MENQYQHWQSCALCQVQVIGEDGEPFGHSCSAQRGGTGAGAKTDERQPIYAKCILLVIQETGLLRSLPMVILDWDFCMSEKILELFHVRWREALLKFRVLPRIISGLEVEKAILVRQ